MHSEPDELVIGTDIKSRGRRLLRYLERPLAYGITAAVSLAVGVLIENALSQGAFTERRIAIVVGLLGLFCVVMVQLRMESVLYRIDHKVEPARLDVHCERAAFYYANARDKNEGENRIHKLASREIQASTKSIKVLTSYLLEGGTPSNGLGTYFRTLTRHITTHPDIAYQRLLQYEAGKDGPEFDRAYGVHCAEMLNLRRANVNLKKMVGTRPTTFMIIDDTTLLWQINRIVERPQKRVELHQMFIIKDPGAKHLINHFIEEFKTYWDGPSSPLSPNEQDRLRDTFIKHEESTDLETA